MRKLFLINVFFAVLCAGLASAANIDTSFKFSTIETKHFSIHFHQGLEELAQKTAVIAEDAHGKLVKKFLWEPKEKTQIVLIDDTDFTNGFATALPYNTIYIKTVPPSIDMTIGEYEDWLAMIIAHEYAHILTMDPARGYSETTRKIFGKPVPGENPFTLLAFIAAAPPNVFLPRWWHEGMATWAETEVTPAGRGRSAYYEMILRAAVTENNIPSVDQINGDIPYWPAGSAPYIFGLRLQKYIADKHGKDLLGKLNLTHAGRFPYFLNGAPAQLLKDKDYVTLYFEMVDDLKKGQKKQIEVLKKQPFTDFKAFKFEGERLTNPRFSPNGKLIAFNKRDPHGHETIMIANSDGTNAADIARRLPSDRSVSWAPDGTKIYFSQAEIVSGFNTYQDLYEYDIKNKKLQKLTEGLRIQEPDISPDGKSFAVIVTKRGSQNLAVLKENKKIETLTDYKLIRVSNPRWSPDGGFIVYCVKSNDGKSGLYLYDSKTKTHKKLFESGFNIANPAWHKDGKHIIFTSDETGVYNLFAYSIEQDKRFQAGHILGGAFHPDISPDGSKIIFSAYNSTGFKIAAMDYNPGRWQADSGPVINPYWEQNSDIVHKSPFTTDDFASRASSLIPRPYSPYDTLKPRFWLPTLSGDREGAVVGAFTAGQDVLGYNTYTAELDAGLSSGKLYYRAAYLNDYLYPTFKLQMYAQPFLYSNLLQRGSYWELSKSLIMEMRVPLNRLESEYLFRAGYQIQKQEALTGLIAGKFNGLPVFEGSRNNLFLGFDFFNNLRYPYSISSEEGRSFSFLHRYYSGSLGSDIHSKEYTAFYKEYFRLPVENLKHHVFYLALNGGVSSGERTVQQAFQLGGSPSPEVFFPLRGYPLRFETGKYITTGTVEYRAPLKYIFGGPGTKPLFVEKMHGAVFVDSGETWDETRNFSSNRLKTGVGAELRFDVTLGYWLKITPTLGVARGLNQNGETQIYFTIYTNL